MRGKFGHRKEISLDDHSLQLFFASAQAGAACIQYVHAPHMHQHSADECMRYFLDNGEKLDKDSGETISEDAIRFVRNMWSVDNNRRFENGKWNYPELEDSTRAQSIGPINEDPNTSHPREQYKVDLNTRVISNPPNNTQ